MTPDELVAALDAKHRHNCWRLWRADYDGRWVAHIEGDSDSTQSGATIAEALQALLDYVPLPVVPRRPKMLARSNFAAVKSGSTWRLEYLGDVYARALPTRKEAYRLADGMTTRSLEASEEWHRRYGTLVASGIEGLTYRWQE